LVESFGEDGSVGLPIQGSIFNKVIDGAQRSCLTIRSGASGTGKTRNAVADACLLAFPMRYNSATAQWEQVGSNQKVLFIITEQTDKQIKKMILAYLSDINESKFKYGVFNDEERKILAQAKQIMKDYSSNFILVRIPNPTIDLVKTKVREKVLLHDIGYVFYDYIFIGPALLNEFRGFGVRNDEVLLMMATALKDLAVELNVCVFTSTQVNANADNNTNIRNESSLAGGRSTINKADNGAIMARPTKEELETLEPITSVHGKPNLVTDIFKVRSGEWTQVRIWSIVNLGTMRRDDLFITDSRLEVINDFYTGDEYNISDFEDDEFLEIKRKVDWLNGL
jgi:replicative DNA helicase